MLEETNSTTTATTYTTTGVGQRAAGALTGTGFGFDKERFKEVSKKVGKGLLGSNKNAIKVNMEANERLGEGRCSGGGGGVGGPVVLYHEANAAFKIPGNRCKMIK